MYVGIADGLPAPAVPSSLPSPLSGRQVAAAPMGGVSEPVHEPRVVSDARSDPARVVLRAGERLEVVVVERLVEPRQGRQAKLVQKLRMPPEASNAFGDGAWGAPHDPGDLPVSGAVDDAAGDRNRELGTLEVVAHRERLLGEPATAGLANEPGDNPAVATSQVGRAKPAVAKRRGLNPVLWTVGARAERRRKLILRDDFDLGARPVHTRALRQVACPPPESKITRGLARLGVRWPSKPSARGQRGQTFCEPL